MRHFAALPIIVVSALIAGCDGLTGTPAVSTVNVSPSAFLIVLNGPALQLTATPVDDDGRPVRGKTVSWSTTDPAIRVSQTGEVTAVAHAFSARVRATVDGKVGEARVQTATGLVSTLVKLTADGSAPAGSKRILQARYTDDYGNGIQGYFLDWKVVSGGGTLSESWSISGGQGLMEVTWTLGPNVGPQTVTGTWPGATELSGSPAVFTVTATAPAAP